MTEEFTTSTGRVIPLRYVARRHVERIRAKYVPPEPPTYSFEAAGGETVTLTHDETTVEESGPEDRAAWAEYQTALTSTMFKLEMETAKFLIYNCVDEEPSPIQDWSVDFTLWGLSLPDPSDPIAFKMEWFESEVIVNEADYAPLMSKLYELGGLLDGERAKEFEAFFRATLARLSTGAGRV